MEHNIRKSIRSLCIGVGRWPFMALVSCGLLIFALPAGAAGRA